MVGRALSHYRILERLGAGGMGEVYRAHDEKLDRDVALKVLPDGALADESARARFRKEAHALSRLSHPHIAHLLDFDSEDGVDFLVMELITGPSLSEKLRDGPLPERDVLRLGAQLARGLQAAHEQGVIHRDLKPSNLHLTPDGLLKILDFGLARLLQPKTTPSADSTATETETAAGTVVGSPPYMAPEQLLGKPLDVRADLYTAGAVLYELATGQRPFGRRDGAALTEAILHEAPPFPTTVRPSVSAGLEEVILQALDKDPELRHQTAKDLLVDLERLQLRSGARAETGRASSAGAQHALHAQPHRRASWLRTFTLVAGAGIVLASGGFWLLHSSVPPAFTNVRPLRLNVGPGFGGDFSPTWTTDGVRLYYVMQEGGRYALYSVALSGGEPARIPTPFDYGIQVFGYLHRDSALIVVPEKPDLTASPPPVWLVPVPAGTPRRLGDLVAHFVAVSPDERILALSAPAPTQSKLTLVSLDGPSPSPLAELRLPPDAGRLMRWSPDGRRLRFTAPGPAGHEVESWIWETTNAASAARPLWPGEGGSWTSDGRLFVFERQPFVALRSDVYSIVDRGWPAWARGGPVQLSRGPVTFTQVGSRPDGRGLLAFGTMFRGELQHFSRRTRQFERVLGGESAGMLQASPDSQWLAWITFPDATLWRSRPDGSERLQLTSPPLQAYMPSWSPDGKRIAFISVDPSDGTGSIRVVSAEGGPVETVHRPSPGSVDWDACWLPDGQSLVFSAISPADRSGIQRLDLAAATASPLEGAEDFLWPKCGPQGQILATRLPGVGDTSRPGVLVVRWPGRREWEDIGPVTTAGAYPTWTRDGRSFCGLTLPQNRIDCYSFPGGRLETIAEVGDTRLLAWINAPWFGLDADDNPLVMFDRSTRDLYALDWDAP